MQIIKSGSRPTRKASSEYFTGTVWQDPIIEADEPARVHALRVSFEPKARTAWHTHPLGQTLYVISGVGLMGLRNLAPQLIKAGDTVWIPPCQCSSPGGIHTVSPVLINCGASFLNPIKPTPLITYSVCPRG